MNNLTKQDFKLAFLAAVLVTEDHQVDVAVAQVAGHWAIASEEEKMAHLEQMKTILENAKQQVEETLKKLEGLLDAEMAGRAG